MKPLQTHEFTLVLSGVDDNTPELEDKLFEAGCDDALVNFRNGTVYLDFSREAASISEAVISAIHQTENSRAGVKIISVLPDDLVNETDIAKRLNAPRQTVSLWVKGARRAQFPFPNPVSKLSEKSPMWHWYEVIKWLSKQRLIKDKKMIESALFIASINTVLSERTPEILEYRHAILQQLKKGKESTATHFPR